MCLAFRLSEQLDLCPPQTASQVTAHLKRAGLPVDIADIASDTPAEAAELVRLMGQDKKVRDGQLTFILARDIGAAFITREVSAGQVEAFLAQQI
jgi:3-dehydroquinate synthetase